MRVIIAGSRSITSYERLLDVFDRLPNDWKISSIVSGHARGVDRLGERVARDLNLPVIAYPALWRQYGDRAGFIRNELMAQNADGAILLWDGKSNGTRHMLNMAVKYKLRIVLVRIAHDQLVEWVTA